MAKRKRPDINRNDAGLTLIEIAIAGGIMVVGLVVLLGILINFQVQSKVYDAQVIATNFAATVMDDMRDRDLEEIVKYNEGNADLATSDGGVLPADLFPGFGTAHINIYAIIPDQDDPRVQIPISDDVLSGLTIPEPVEIQIEIVVDSSSDDDDAYVYQLSSMISPQ